MLWEGRIGTQTTNLDRLHVTVWEADSLAGEATVIWEKAYEPFPESQAAFRLSVVKSAYVLYNYIVLCSFLSIPGKKCFYVENQRSVE